MATELNGFTSGYYQCLNSIKEHMPESLEAIGLYQAIRYGRYMYVGVHGS